MTQTKYTFHDEKGAVHRRHARSGMWIDKNGMERFDNPISLSESGKQWFHVFIRYQTKDAEGNRMWARRFVDLVHAHEETVTRFALARNPVPQGLELGPDGIETHVEYRPIRDTDSFAHTGLQTQA